MLASLETPRSCVSSLDEDMLIYWCLMDGIFDCISFVRVCALEMDAKRHGKYLGSTVTLLYGPSVLRDLVRLFTSARRTRSHNKSCCERVVLVI